MKVTGGEWEARRNGLVGARVSQAKDKISNVKEETTCFS